MSTDPIVRTLTVAAPPERAFEVFTAGMARWWNGEYHLGDKPFVDVVVEPRAGGRWYERDAEGAECTWGRVLAWEPPGRLVLAWQISADWTYDPELVTQIEVRFAGATGPDGAATTRVDFEHRGLDAYGEQAAEMRASLGSPGGWGGLLEAFADKAGG
ncbi:SRPBCC family protein [Cellulomonas phragmiteti]|uniref:ATPase n=1 Tax=Cellulomonas phragmiteti TaxID=478780 RepID=A0ABQ4DQ09_9CELL|nr:SRPBCC family protein [Cellulomonas phragmiteti]GIG41432.1 ATPase [Cellulomonas phragmiteti]